MKWVLEMRVNPLHEPEAEWAEVRGQMGRMTFPDEISAALYGASLRATQPNIILRVQPLS